METWIKWLVVGGMIPFLVSAGLLIAGVNTVPVLGAVSNILSSYAVVIASFMAGAHWGQHLDFRGKWAVRLPIFSNLTAVGVWLVFLLCPFREQLFLYAGVFALLLWVDQKLYVIGFIRRDYFSLRCVATGVVVTTLLVVGVWG